MKDLNSDLKIILKLIYDEATRHELSMAQLALLYVLQEKIEYAIIGARTIAQLKSLMGLKINLSS